VRRGPQPRVRAIGCDKLIDDAIGEDNKHPRIVRTF